MVVQAAELTHLGPRFSIVNTIDEFMIMRTVTHSSLLNLAILVLSTVILKISPYYCYTDFVLPV